MGPEEKKRANIKSSGKLKTAGDATVVSDAEAGNNRSESNMKAKRSAQKRKRVYLGFADGRPAYTLIDTGFGGWGKGCYRSLAFFIDKASAKHEYEDFSPGLLTYYLLRPGRSKRRLEVKP